MSPFPFLPSQGDRPGEVKPLAPQSPRYPPGHAAAPPRKPVCGLGPCCSGAVPGDAAPRQAGDALWAWSLLPALLPQPQCKASPLVQGAL